MDFSVNGCRAVLPDDVLEDASVRVEEGRIAEVAQGRSFPGGIEAGGAWLLPGIVDIHSDAIEKAIEPRPRAFFPSAIAIRELDRALCACGITTMFHSLSFADMEDGFRSNGTAARHIDEIAGMAPSLRCDTRIHARFEITDLGAVPHLRRLVEEGKVGLLSFMDHSPGQGQYRDAAAYKGYYGKVYAKSDEELDRIIDRKLRARDDGLAGAVDEMVSLCRASGVAMASHDDDSPDRVAWCRERGIAVSEFPVNLETARAAREVGLSACLGAPNLVRGGSQAGNLSVRAALEAGCGDILCSDYLPSSVLHAVFLVAAWGIRPLHEAAAMASLAPARAVGIGDLTGSVEPGKRADLLLAGERGGIPDLLRAWRGGRPVYATC